MNLEDLLKIEPYSLAKKDKEELFSSYLGDLTAYHYAQCTPYRKILDSIQYEIGKKCSHYDLPFLPAQLFKTNKLVSTPNESSLKTLSSSGTSGQAKTQVFLDKENAINQTKVLSKIVFSFIGNKRLPMLIIDSRNVINNRAELSARAAGVIGFSLLGSKPTYVVNEKMELDIELLHSFLKQHQRQQILLFGFTFMVFQHFYKAVAVLKEKPDLSNAILIHGGGWKKLEKEAISPENFKTKLKEACKIQHVYDYYGMAEQTGSIFMQCEKGNYHASIFSDVIIRRALDFSKAEIGEEGIIQVFSLLPKSYPGHSILTSDKGALLGEDDCPCKRRGKYFRIRGRLKDVELRGCSDTYA